MIRRPPRSTQSRSSAASDVYKRQLDVVVVEKRFPHAHKDHIGDLFSFGFQLAGKGQHLFSDLGRREDSLETQVSSSAERTINLAASLGGDAHRATAVSVFDENTLYGEVVAREEQVLT